MKLQISKIIFKHLWLYFSCQLLNMTCRKHKEKKLLKSIDIDQPNELQLQSAILDLSCFCFFFFFQVSEVINMMKKLVNEESEEAKLVENFSRNLSLTQTSEQISEDVKQLLQGLDRVSINQSCNGET